MTQSVTAAATVGSGLKYSHRSYSQANQLRTCGEQFRLERVEKTPSRPSCAALAGIAVHTGTEHVDELFGLGGYPPATWERSLVVPWSIDAALEALDKEMEQRAAKGWPEESYKKYGKQDIEWFRNVGIPNSIAAYVDWRLEHPDFVLAEIPDFGPAVEVPFNYYIGDQLVVGWIDRVFQSVEHDSYHPVDLKSGRKPKTDEQLGLYARALNAALGWNVEWGYYLYELKSGTAKMTPPLRVNHWTDEKLAAIYLPATKMIELGLYLPSPGEACWHCGVSDACQFTQAVI